MLSKVKDSIKHSAIYSFGNISTKLIGIILLPLYTKYITVAEYGIIGVIEVTIMILTQTMMLGQPQAFLRFYNINIYKHKRKTTLFTLFILLFSTGLIICIIGQYFSKNIASFFDNPSDFEIYIRLSFVIIYLRILNEFFLSVLRAKEKSVLFASANIFKLGLILGFNIYFIAFLRIGIRGILYSYLISDIGLLLLLSPSIILQMSAKFDLTILRLSISFGFPLIFTSLAGMLLNLGDRYILKYFVDYKEVGLYNLGYKLAGILNVFFIQSFTLGFLPLAYKYFQQKDDKRYYSKMLTYFMFVLCWAGLGLSLFSAEAIKILALNPEYWPAYTVVPIITLAYVFSGGKSITSIGLYLTHKTQVIAYSTIIVTLLNIGLNLLLIPKYGMMGAATATLIAFIILYIVSQIMSNRFYKIPFENHKILILLITTIALYFIPFLFPDLPLLIITIKILILVSFPFILYLFKFYETIEILKLKQSWKKWRNPHNWKKTFPQ
ncbi:MAG: oligosaccharide flippase family protein [Ignavibacteriales bacterium]|nr:oligosaccharide flippase family protein [Ignavibacteriales bacterium]